MLFLTPISSPSRPKVDFQRNPLPHFIDNRNYFLRTMDEFLINVWGKYVFFDTQQRLIMYFVLVSVFTFFGQLWAPLPIIYITQKRNIFNDHFVKLGLFWTTTLLLPFILLTSIVYSGLNIRIILKQLSRLVVGTLFWYAFTKLIFANVEHITGVCSKATFVDQFSCVRGGGHWYAFEISGHCFLLAYCSLMIAEELLVFQDLLLVPKFFQRNQLIHPDDPNILNENEEENITVQYKKFMPAIRGLFIILSILMLLWDFMFIITSMYYHSWYQKIIGLAFGGGSWYLTYVLWYRTPLSPGLPGDCKLIRSIDSKRKMLLAAD